MLCFVDNFLCKKEGCLNERAVNFSFFPATMCFPYFDDFTCWPAAQRGEAITRPCSSKFKPPIEFRESNSKFLTFLKEVNFVTLTSVFSKLQWGNGSQSRQYHPLTCCWSENWMQTFCFYRLYWFTNLNLRLIWTQSKGWTISCSRGVRWLNVETIRDCIVINISVEVI